MIDRVVFDISTLVSAAIRVGSIPHQALMCALEFCQLCRSDQSLAQLDDVLHRSRFNRYLPQSDREQFVSFIQEEAKLFVVFEKDIVDVRPSCRDTSDNFLLALALAAKADAIVSSDHDLLVLHPWREIAILTPAQFITQFSH